MSILRLFLLILIAFFLYRIVRRFFLGLSNNTKRTESHTSQRTTNKKYDNIEEAKYEEIKDDEK